MTLLVFSLLIRKITLITNQFKKYLYYFYQLEGLLILIKDPIIRNYYNLKKKTIKILLIRFFSSFERTQKKIEA